MKKQLLLIGLAALFVAGVSAFTGCKSSGKKTTPEQEQVTPGTEHEMEAPDTAAVDTSATAEVHYQCPMKCEGDKTYDQPGKCPVCGMDLVAVNEEMHEAHGEAEHAEGEEHEHQ